MSGLRGIAHEVSPGGEPWLVFLSGHRTPMSSWRPLLDALGDDLGTLRHDRPGTGASAVPTVPQSGREVCTTLLALLALLALLDAHEVPAPVVLVGHSLGGLHANLFARTHPARVAAVALIESGHPDEAGETEQEQGGWATRLVRRVFDPARSAFGRDPNSEYNNVAATVRQIAAAPAFPDVPLLVLSGEKRMFLVPEAVHAAHLERQAALVSLSPCGERVIAARSGHLPQLSEPALVAEALRGLVARVPR